MPSTKRRALAAVRPTAALRVAYRRKLVTLVDEMARSYAWWLGAQYRKKPPRMAVDLQPLPEDERRDRVLKISLALDATPAAELRRELGKLGSRWQKRLDDAAPELARWFAKSAWLRSDRALLSILRRGGLSVRFPKFTPELRDVMEASVAENVSLIKSIGSQFHTEVEGLVMRSVATGRDLEQLTRDLQERYGVTRRRAEFIALDQNNKATSQLQVARQTGIGIDEGDWLHSHAGKKPRPTHLANHGKRFSLREGWFDPDPKVRKRIWPGQLINCHCTWKPVVKGFS
jgi:SPP1 gp7 family putative phage head morphogenesis protein